MEDNNNYLKKINVSSSRSKLFLVKKIKLKKFPELSKNLKTFFWDRDKYFQQNYKNYYILVGNRQNKKTKTSIGNKRKIERRKTRRFMNMVFNPNEKKSNESKVNTSPNDKQRGIPKNIKETGLKIGQKYINDFELEDLFNAFKTVQKLNKKRSNNFLFPNQYLDKNSSITASKTSNKYLYDKKSSKNFDSKNLKDIENRIASSGRGRKDINLSNKKSNKSELNNNINNEYYKTISTFTSIKNIKDIENDNLNDSSSKNINNFCSISKMNLLNNPLNIEYNNFLDKKPKTASNFYNLNSMDEKNINSRKRLIKRQNQFLLSPNEEDDISPHKTKRLYYAQILANQEQALSKTSKIKLKINTMYNVVSHKSHKSRENLLMKNIDSYRIKNELKDKFTFLNSKLEPEHIYNWIKDLREETKTIKTNENNTNYYIIRDPFTKKMYNSTIRNIGKKKNLKQYKPLIDEMNNINNNYEGLYIKGKNLLNIEYNQVKSLKNKKILNNYEIYLPTTDVEDILFTDEKYINIKNQNQNSKE